MDTRENRPRRVLLVEDDTDLGNVVSFNLEQAGYVVRVVTNAAEAWEALPTFQPHVMLLDIMLPGMSGTELCRRVRAQADLAQPAIIMLTARGDEIDRVVGFEVGADDYVVKPFSVRELMLRVAAMFRSGRVAEMDDEGEEPVPHPAVEGEHDRRRLRVGELTVDIDGHHVFVGDNEIHVSTLEMRLLVYLIQARGRVRSRDQLLAEVWGYKPGVSTRTVDTHVKRLRDKLETAGPLIETVRGVGYRFAAETAAVTTA